MINPFKKHFTKSMNREVEIGRHIEMEHTDNKSKARFIAMQHVAEFPNYYSKGLVPMEKRLRRK